MNKATIQRHLRHIEKAKVAGCLTEAIITYHHLNTSLIHVLSATLLLSRYTQEIKTKLALDFLLEEVSGNTVSKSVISKKQLKPVKTWFKHSESYIKDLRNELPQGARQLLHESENAFTMLHIAVSKIRK